MSRYFHLKNAKTETLLTVSNLGQDVVHCLGCTGVTLAEYPQQPQYFNLEEGIGDARYVVLGRVPGHD